MASPVGLKKSQFFQSDTDRFKHARVRVRNAISSNGSTR